MKLLRPLFAAIVTLLSIGAANAQGTIPIALQQSVNQNGQPLVGCLLYIFQAGTVATPQNAFSDSGLTLPLSNPLVCDNNGRLPMFYLASGSVHVRLTDASGIVQFDYPSMLVIGSAGGGGGGGGGTVDPTSVASSGDVKFRPTSESLTGWVKLNGQSIGTASSGATSRANADTQALYVYLWTNCVDAHCPVSTGRGASGLADFNANKTLTLPDWRGRTPVGLDDMGASAAGRLLASNVTGGDSVTTPGAVGGAANSLIGQTNLPSYNLTGGTASTVSASGQGQVKYNQASNLLTGGASTYVINIDSTGATTSNSAVSVTVSGSATGVSISSGGGGVTFPTISPFMLGSWHMKL